MSMMRWGVVLAILVVVGVVPGLGWATEFRDCDTCPVMVTVPAGSFLMGSDPNWENGSNHEHPRHRVTIGAAFAIGKFDVTQAEYFAVMGANPSDFKGMTRPVEEVNWEEAREFVKRLSARTGKPYRLPTEAEWEYAARAGTETPWSFGDDESKLPLYAWFSGNSGSQTHPVGQLRPNGFGLYDMHGNVWQWVEDCWHDTYQGAPVNGSAWTASGCDRRVLRGGSWNYIPIGVRSANRDWLAPVYRDRNIYGFRVARTITP
jgi:formylglycine-generating enzyme required for sulfatase activity